LSSCFARGSVTANIRVMGPRVRGDDLDGHRATQLALTLRVTHVMAMSNEEILIPNPTRSRGDNSRGDNSRGDSSRRPARGPIIDQEGREIPPETLGEQFQRFRFDFGHSSANPFGDLTREQRLARFEALAKLLDIAFILPGTKIRYGIDGIIRLIPVIGDLFATAFSLWLVREARALGAPWHVTARMLGNVAVDGVVGMVPFAGDAFDVLFRANMRNVRLLRRWMDRQPR
jgi:Domain of unknown function (DUF4112)